MKVLIINGPNLDMLGSREKEVYGEQTLADMNAEIAEFCAAEGMDAVFFQSNCEGEIVTALNTRRALVSERTASCSTREHTLITRGR